MEKLGIEPVQILIQIFNFLLMVFILTKLLYRPIIKSLEERKKKIAEGLEYADKMREEAEKNEKKRDEIISQAKDEARKAIEEGKKAGKKLEAEIVEKAHEEAELIIEKGRKELDLEGIEIEKNLRKQTIEIAANMAEKVISEVLTQNDHEAIINKKLQEIARIR